MSRILLVDDSPHAQRMGERILSEEGFEVVTVSNADSALIRMEDVDPDVVLADTVMPGRSGYELCQFVKMSPRLRHIRVVLTAGVLEPLDEEQVKRVQADATLQKPFEASLLTATVKPLAERAAQERSKPAAVAAGPTPKNVPPVKTGPMPFAAVVDAEQIRAAVTVALDAAMEAIVDEISTRVLAVLQSRKPAASPAPAQASEGAPVPAVQSLPAVSATTVRQVTRVGDPPPMAAPAALKPPTPVSAPTGLKGPPVPTPLAPAPPAASTPSTAPPPRLETVRRVSTLRSRPGSILGLDLSYVDSEAPAAAPHSSALEPLFPNSRPAADPDPGPGPKNSPEK
jgi:CheY-like chemotaxis protein